MEWKKAGSRFQSWVRCRRLEAGEGADSADPEAVVEEDPATGLADRLSARRRRNISLSRRHSSVLTKALNCTAGAKAKRAVVRLE